MLSSATLRLVQLRSTSPATLSPTLSRYVPLSRSLASILRRYNLLPVPDSVNDMVNDEVSERGPKDRKRRCDGGINSRSLSLDWAATPEKVRVPRSMVGSMEGSEKGPKRGSEKGSQKGVKRGGFLETAWDREIPGKPGKSAFCAFRESPPGGRKYDPVKTVHQHLSRLGELLNTLENVHPPGIPPPGGVSGFLIGNPRFPPELVSAPDGYGG